MRKAKITFQCSEEEAMFFQSLPKAMGITMSALVRDSLYFYYKNHLNKSKAVVEKTEQYLPA